MSLLNEIPQERAGKTGGLNAMDLKVINRSGQHEPFDEQLIINTLNHAARGYEKTVNIFLIVKELYRTIFDGITTIDLEKGLILASTTFIEQDPAYSHIASRLLLLKL